MAGYRQRTRSVRGVLGGANLTFNTHKLLSTTIYKQHFQHLRQFSQPYTAGQ
jgi:hypothetical protein